MFHPLPYASKGERLPGKYEALVALLKSDDPANIEYTPPPGRDTVPEE